MLKIGTGELGTIAGEVYLQEPVKKTEEICWVYMKHKLYLKSHAKEVLQMLVGMNNIINRPARSKLYVLTPSKLLA